MLRPRLQISFSAKDAFRFLSGKRYVPERNRFLLNHARTGIYVVLQTLHLPPNAKIAVMTYNCNSVMAAIAKAGYNIVFVDITEKLQINLQDLAQKIEGVSVLVVTHLYGIVNDIDAIKALYPHLIIVEDCAHAWHSKSKGNVCGEKGDFAVFSVGQAKLPSIGDGGILQVNNAKYLSAVREQAAKLPTYSAMQELILLLRLQISSLLFLPGIYGIWHLFKPQRVKTRDFVPMQMAHGVSRLLLSKQKETDSLIRNRRTNCDAWLAKLPPELLPIIGDEGWNFFMLPVWCENPTSVIKNFAHNDIEVAVHFKNAIAWARNYGYSDGSCPISETIVNHLVTIPTYYTI